MGCRGSTLSNDGSMQRPTPGSPGGRRRSAAGTAKPARSLGGRAVRRGYPGCWEEHPRDRARADRRAAAGVVAHALLAPGRTDRRGVRNGRLGHELARRARSSGSSRPSGSTSRSNDDMKASLAALVVSRGSWVAWSRCAPILPRRARLARSASSISRNVLSFPRCPAVGLWLLPCWEASRHSIAGMLLVSLRLLLDRAWGRVQEAERALSDPTPSSAGSQDIVYVTGYVSHCTGYRFNLVHTMTCPESRAGVR